MVKKLKPSKSGGRKKKGASDGAPVEEKKEPSIRLHAEKLAQLAAGGDTTALAALEKIVSTFEAWKRALGKQREETKACAELVGAAEARFGVAVEEAPPVEPVPGEDWAFTKLRTVEGLWQDWSEAKAEAIERKKTAYERVQKLGKQLERATQDGAQLTIPGT